MVYYTSKIHTVGLYRTYTKGLRSTNQHEGQIICFVLGLRTSSSVKTKHFRRLLLLLKALFPGSPTEFNAFLNARFCDVIKNPIPYQDSSDGIGLLPSLLINMLSTMMCSICYPCCFVFVFAFNKIHTIPAQ
uniref:Uncharacterized protein n=1 Tax=Cacopsylla melanoneura TaxID=428564 RepID=A0A8D8RF47_9HEMI